MHDDSTKRDIVSDRKLQILKCAIDILIEKGYGELTMRALARGSGLKLGALQYHFRTKDDMLRALVGYLAGLYETLFESMAHEQDDELDILGLIEFLGASPDGIEVDRFLPQLWAMGQVEPLVADLFNEIYAKYLQILEERLVAAGAESPRAEALCLMSMVEGSILFTGHGRPWSNDAEDMQATVAGFIEAKYGKGA